MSIYVRLKEIRESKGLTQQQLAEAVKMHVSSIQKIERQAGKSITYDSLERLCLALDCSPGDMFEFKQVE